MCGAAEEEVVAEEAEAEGGRSQPDAVFICLLRGSNHTCCLPDFSTCSFQAVVALGLQ